MALALPVMAEQILHMIVGFTDTYLANHLPADAPAAAAAVGTIAYVLWFIGLFIGAIGTGSTAIIARARGARNRRLANSVCGQSVTTAIVMGLAIGVGLFLLAGPIVALTNLHGSAGGFALVYLRLLCFSLPLSMLMFIASACLRGAGDTLTPAIVMIVVDGVNIVFSFALTYGWGPFPAMGFSGIALGTVIAYAIGGFLQFFLLLSGRGKIRLHLHRLRPHYLTLKRILRIGIPAGTEGLLTWIAQFAIVIVINGMDVTNDTPAAHVNAIRIESISFLSGFAFATAAATMVGQALGMDDSRRAARSAYFAYAAGGGLMTVMGVLLFFFAHYPAAMLAANDHIAELSTRCLQIAALAQCGFAASMIFSGALRGAGDTLSVMLINLFSIVGIRLAAVLVVTEVFHQGLLGVWTVLAIELMIRGALVYARFLHGGWRTMTV